VSTNTSTENNELGSPITLLPYVPNGPIIAVRLFLRRDNSDGGDCSVLDRSQVCALSLGSLTAHETHLPIFEIKKSQTVSVGRDAMMRMLLKRVFRKAHDAM
jgi:hypothetical protein